MKIDPKKALPVLCIAGVLALAGCNKNSTEPVAPNNSPGQYIDDAAITTKVKATLAGDSALKSSDISVTTNSGVVTLSGQVDTSDQKSAAAKDTGMVSGVKDVTNNLTTK